MEKWLVCITIPVLVFTLMACRSEKKLDIIKITPAEILKVYQSGASAGDRQFKGAKVEVTGTVGEIDNDLNGRPFVVFALDSEISPIFNFEKRQAQAVASLKAGDKVTLTCTGAGELVRIPTFNDCKITGDVSVDIKK